MTLAVSAICLTKMKNSCKILAGGPEWKRTLYRRRFRLEGNIIKPLSVTEPEEWD
jgi:hypothetical protein